MKTILYPNQKPLDFDDRIADFLAAMPEVPYPSGVRKIGIKNDAWQVYRAIETVSPIQYLSVCDFLENLGLVDFLDPGETVDGFDSIFAADD